MIYDITRTVSPELTVWPGDAAFSFVQTSAIESGGAVNLTTLTISPHTGTHMDAPWHYVAGGTHPAEVPLEPYIGRARVVTVNRERGGITPDDIAGADLEGVERLLLRTWASETPDTKWPVGYVSLTVELIDWLADSGVKLIGMDMPSVDAFENKALDVHKRIGARGLYILERVDLSGVPDDDYELIALPLKIADVCGSPVRAVLRTL